jgi:hypothetical protein
VVAEGRVPVRRLCLVVVTVVGVAYGVGGDVVRARGGCGHGGLEAGDDGGEVFAVELEVAGPARAAQLGLQCQEAVFDVPCRVLVGLLRPQCRGGGTDLVEQPVGVADGDVAQLPEPVIELGPILDRQPAGLADDRSDLGPADPAGLERGGEVGHGAQGLGGGGQHAPVRPGQPRLHRQQMLERQPGRAFR